MWEDIGRFQWMEWQPGLFRDGTGDRGPVVQAFARFEEETLALSRDGKRDAETWNGSWATPLTMGRHQRADDSYFTVWTDDGDETWLWQNEVGCANGDIEPCGPVMGPYATAVDAARAAWPNLALATPKHTREAAQEGSCPECGGSVFGPHHLDSKGRPVCGAATKDLIPESNAWDGLDLAGEARSLFAAEFPGGNSPDDAGLVAAGAIRALEKALSARSRLESNAGVREAIARAIAEHGATEPWWWSATFDDGTDGTAAHLRAQDLVTADAIMALLPASIDVLGKAREALEQTAADFDDLADLARKRVDDGDEMGSPYWRQTLTDIAQEARDNSIRARTALASLTGEGL
jgi:hypothetical protein